MRFASPYMFLLLLLIPLLVYVELRRNRRGAMRFSTTAFAGAADASWRRRFHRLPLMLRLAALALFVIALARPQMGLEKIYDISRGIAIEMVVDRSSSMSENMEFEGRTLNRLQVVKEVFAEFVRGNDDALAGRPNDLVGMVSFARYADTICPLTLAHDALLHFIDSIHLVRSKAEDGTAIGDALMLAAARLKTAEDDLQRYAEVNETPGKVYQIKSKIIILLTDGHSNRGQNSPLEAAKLARQWGIKIYTIGVGGEAQVMIPGLFGLKIPAGQAVDSKTLEAIAETTGGMFRLAEDAEALRAIYREIDQLEKSEVESIRHVDYRENFPPFALAGLLLLILELLLANTLFRKIP